MTTTSRSRSHLALLALGALLGACTSDGVYVADDLDLDLSIDVGRPDDELHLPYVRGTTVNLRPGIVDGDGSTSTAGYRVESADSGVLAPDGAVDPSSGEQAFVAVAAGTTTVHVLDPDGDTVHSAEITVRAPTRAELYPASLQRVHTGQGRVALERAQVLQDGTATFLIHYFDGDERLHGNGVLTASSDADLGLVPTTTYVFQNREWLEMTPHTLGSHDVAIEADGIPLGAFEVEVVPASAVSDVEIIGEDESDAEDGDTLSVLAQAYDAEGDPIYGVTYQWDLDGVEQVGDGDLYQYEYAGAAPAALGATFGDLRAQADIHAGSGIVGSSTEVGCSVAPGTRGPSTLGVLATLTVLALALRKRGARRGRGRTQLS